MLLSNRLQKNGKEAVGPHGSGNVWNEKKDGNIKSLVEIVELFSEKTATTLMTATLAVYSVCAILLDFVNRNRQQLIGNGYTLLGIPSVGCTDRHLGGDGWEGKKLVRVGIDFCLR